MFETVNDFYHAAMAASICVIQKIIEAMDQRNLYFVCCKFFLEGLFEKSQVKTGFSFDVSEPFSRLLQTPFVGGRVYVDYLGRYFSQQYIFEYENLQMNVERNSDTVERLEKEISEDLVGLKFFSFEIVTQNQKGNYTIFVLDHVPCPDPLVRINLRPPKPTANC